MMPSPQGKLEVVLSRLAAAAELGLPCPTNAELKEPIGVRSACYVSELMCRMKRRDMIRVETNGGFRRVQIIATGKWTDWTLPQQNQAAPPETVYRAVDDPARWIVRDPCFKCGVPRFKGCPHHPIELAA